MEQDVFEAHMEGLKALINLKFEEIEKSNKAIIEQTTKTNGRVTSLETWKNKIVGALDLVKFVGFTQILLIVALLVDYCKK